MSKRPTPTAIRDHYRDNVAALRPIDLARMVRGEFEPATPKYIRKELLYLANEESLKRGIEYPYFASFFVTGEPDVTS